MKFKGEQTEVLRRKLSNIEKRLQAPVQPENGSLGSQERLGSGGLTEGQKVETTQLQKQRDTRDKSELIGRPIVIRGKTWRGPSKVKKHNSRVSSRQDGKKKHLRRPREIEVCQKARAVAKEHQNQGVSIMRGSLGRGTRQYIKSKGETGMQETW